MRIINSKIQIRNTKNTINDIYYKSHVRGIKTKKKDRLGPNLTKSVTTLLCIRYKWIIIMGMLNLNSMIYQYIYEKQL
jgi:hypothetical protein